MGDRDSVITGSDRKVPRRLSRLGAMLMLAVLPGCGMSSMTSGFLGGGTAPSPAGVSEEGLLAAAKSDATGVTELATVANACPQFVVWPNDRELTTYEPGRDGEALGVVNRGEITQTARECTIEPGQITVKYGFSGRVLLGPRGQPGPISLPTSVILTDANREKLQVDPIAVDIVVAPGQSIGYFSVVRVLSFPIEQGARPADFRIYVGFARPTQG